MTDTFVLGKFVGSSIYGEPKTINRKFYTAVNYISYSNLTDGKYRKPIDLNEHGRGTWINFVSYSDLIFNETVGNSVYYKWKFCWTNILIFYSNVMFIF